ncbi:MAG: cupin domain-containing protein, partial [Chloroflexota bacterium]
MIPPSAILVAAFALVFALVAPVAAETDLDGPARGDKGRAVLAIYHGPVTVSLADPDSDGHQLGDLRVTSVATTTADGEPLGRLDATLTTTAVDIPDKGDEIRISALVFSFDDDEASQVVVGGSAGYPAQGPTIVAGDTTVRSIIGGSGRFAGASGSAVTVHLEDGSWVHYLKFSKAKGRPDGLDKLFERELRDRLKARFEGFRADRQARQEERRERLAARRSARRADRASDRTDVSPGPDASLGDGADAAAGKETGVTRTDLGVVEPESAPGQELGLRRFSIPAGSELVAHTHPGWQIARIVDGELEYTIISGAGTLIRSDGSSESIRPGAYTFIPGHTVVESP